VTENRELDFDSLTASLREFAQRRDWEKFHSPKNLAMAVAGETGELVAEFQWMSSEESHRGSLSEEKLQLIAMEIADVQIYLLRLADVLGIDVPTAVRQKIGINEERF